MRDEPKISAIIPTYNRGYCISRALKSIEDQTQPVHEILVVDDDDKIRVTCVEAHPELQEWIADGNTPEEAE